jgi:MFS transporter, DHA1 family, multidrug resistance protein
MRDTTGSVPAARSRIVPGSAAFIALIASLMTMTAMTIDINLPSIPATAEEFGASLATGQLTVTLFFWGFAIGQMIWGAASDRFGRKPLLLIGIVLFVLSSIACMLATSMQALLLMRMVQGFGAGAGSVLARTVIRDLFEGQQMARIMSLALAAFVTAPIVAPALGALILQIGSWRLIFGFLVVYGAILFVLAARFLPESLKEPRRDALRPARIAGGYGAVFGHPASRAYAGIVVFAFGPLTIYLTNGPAMFMDSYGMSEGGFALVFAATACASAAGNLANARLVRHLSLMDVTRLGIGGAALAIASGLLVELFEPSSGWALVPSLSVFFFCFGLIVANATALCLGPHGSIAGAATSALGVGHTIVPATIAGLVAGLYDGTAIPALAAMLGCIAISGIFFLTSPKAPGH